MIKILDSWCWINLIEICDIKTGKKDVNEGNPIGAYNFFTCAAEPLKSHTYSFEGESILLPGNGANVGLALYYNGKFEAYQRTYILSNFQVYCKFIFYYLKAFWKTSLEDKQYGSATNYIRLGNITDFNIPIPPLNEQRRIVEKLEKLLAKVDTCKQRLDKIPNILKRFRQSVLAAACSGRLTADWRENNPDVESASELLGKSVQEILFELPQNWYLVSVADVIKNLKYGTSKKCSYDSQGIPVLRIPNVSNGTIDHSDLKYAEFSEKEYEELKLIQGDILIIRSNGSVSLVGKSAIIGKAEIDFAYAGYLIRLRPNCQLIDPTYLNMVLSSYEVRLQIEIPARSTSGVNNINSQEVKQLKIPVPPLAEQQEIINRVQTLFKLADQIEQRYQKAKNHIDQLTQSILAKAFRGELVPQDPNDEPASVLLERIRAERTKRETETAKKSTGQKGKRRSKKTEPQPSEPIPNPKKKPEIQNIITQNSSKEEEQQELEFIQLELPLSQY